MQFRAIATDYDGTIALNGRVAPSLVDLLRAVRASGRKLLLVTGRDLPDLKSVFPPLAIFDLVVAENGALLYRPATGEEELLSEPVSAALVEELGRRGVRPLNLGLGIAATSRVQEAAVLAAIGDLGLDLQVIRNKDSLMVLPAGTNKGTGLEAALCELGLFAANVVGFGDAENDQAFLCLCGCSVAVANALDSVKARADIVTRGEAGRGVSEVLEALLADDLAGYGVASVSAQQAPASR